MFLSKRYYIKKSRLSDSFYVLEKIEGFLRRNEFDITLRKDNSLKFRYKYLNLMVNSSLACGVRRGRVKLSISNDRLVLTVGFPDKWFIVFLGLIGVLLSYGCINHPDNISGYITTGLVFIILIGGNHIIRYIYLFMLFKRLNSLIQGILKGLEF